ncbi:MAG: tyrosine-type recombinase/integrase, partial [Candidatus Aminicenantales bacterium]
MNSPLASHEELLQRFCEFLSIEKGLSSNTIRAYSGDLGKLFLFFAKEKILWHRAKEEDLIKFIHHQSRANMSARSIARMISSVKAFYRFLLLDGVLSKNPAANLSTPKVWMDLPKFLTEEEVERLLAQPEEKTASGLRDKAMLELFYATGLRVSELVALRVGDVNLEQGFILCRGKGGKERIVPVGHSACAALERYIKSIRPRLLKKEEHVLFLTNRGAGFTRQGIW